MRFLPRTLSAIALSAACATAVSGAQDGSPHQRWHLAAVRQPAAASAPAGWRMAATIATPGKNTVMLSAAAPTLHNGWAVGLSAGPAGGKARALVEHWSGRSWRRMKIPRALTSAFDAHYPSYAVIGASPDGSAWAVSQLNGTWLHWNGHRWTEGSLTTHPRSARLAINSVLVLSRHDAWAFGLRLGSRDEIHPYATHFDGRQWRAVPMPAARGLPVADAAAVSPSDIWAVLGAAGNAVNPPAHSGATMAHWNGRHWTLVTLPEPFARHGDAASVTAVSDKNIWVGGGRPNVKGGLTETAAHWNGRQWKVYRLPAAPASKLYVLTRIVPSGRHGLQALATCSTCSKANWSRLWRFAGSRWAGPSRPSVAGRLVSLTDLVQAGPSGSDWATGFIRAGSLYDGVIAVHGAVRG